MTPEYYRPETWDEIVGQPVEKIRDQLESPPHPNFLFYGPPGTGKTTVAYQIARELHGDTDELMEFNASDDRGIDVVRDEIIPSVPQTTLTGNVRVIFLDEMESMTVDAQMALREPMERSDAVFILACNDVTAVHPAIEDRCKDYEFAALSDTAVRTRVKEIADDMGHSLSESQIDYIVSMANGSMRGAIHNLGEPSESETPDERIHQAAANFGTGD